MKNQLNFWQKLLTTSILSLSLLSCWNSASHANNLEEIFAGKKIPLTLKLRDLNADWRKVSIDGQLGMGDLVKNWTTFLESFLGTKTYSNVYYSQGKTVTIGENIYIVAYRLPLKVEPLDVGNLFANFRGNKNCQEGKAPVRLTPNTEVSLSLLNLNSVGFLNDLLPLDIQAEIAESERKYQAAVMVCEQSVIKRINQQTKEYIKTINRDQQGYHLVHGSFTNSWQDLALDKKNKSENHSFLIKLTNNSVVTQARAKSDKYYSYVGAVFHLPESGNFISLICRSQQPTTEKLPNPILKNNQAICPNKTIKVN